MMDLRRSSLTSRFNSVLVKAWIFHDPWGLENAVFRRGTDSALLFNMQTMTAPNMVSARNLANSFVATGYTISQERSNGFVLRNNGMILAIKVSS